MAEWWDKKSVARKAENLAASMVARKAARLVVQMALLKVGPMAGW